MTSPARPMAAFPTMVILCLASLGGCHWPLPEQWALLEITGLPDGSAGKVEVFAQGGSFAAVEVRIAPPDRDGRTWFPYWGPFRTWRSSETLDPARLRIVTPAKIIELDVSLEGGAVSERDGVSVRVIRADAAPPPAPTVTLVPGSSPPVFVIDGYIRVFKICDCDNDREVWSTSTSTVAGSYVHSIEVGTPPAGWEVSTAGGGCHWSVLCSDGLRPIVYLPFSNEVIVGEAYCVDAGGAVVSCSAHNGGSAD